MILKGNSTPFAGDLVINQALYLVHTADTDKTRLSRLVGVGGVNGVGDSHTQFSVVLGILATEQFCRQF